MGALFSLYDKIDDPAEIARAAVEACVFDTACAPPIHLHTVELG